MRTGDAPTWPWERMARSNAPSHDLLVELLEPRAGERWLDVGTGSGGVALRVARRGADVVGVDVADDAIERARETAAAERVGVRFEVADAAALPFGDGEFDGVASAFGVMFGPHEQIAAELARVCRAAGRLGLTLMPPGSRAAELWSLLVAFGADVAEHPARFAERVDELLGGAFELETRRVEYPPEEDEHSPEESWEMLRESFAPLRHLLERLDEPQGEELRREFVAIGHRFAGEPRSYVLVLGRRR